MDSFQKNLLDWYDKNARMLPWRISPQDRKLGILPNPYHVWLSEVMLQQTTVATVKGYFEKFIALWPTLTNLAEAERDDIMSAWAGLGYYSRARNLKACADIVEDQFGGDFPSSQSELIKLPGIGEYTSAAIAAIAFEQHCEVVDGNIERVITRHTANPTPLPRVKSDCRTFMGTHTPVDRPGDFVQAMMDLGATICTPKNPACGLCPVNRVCKSREAGTMLEFPVKAPKRKKPTRKGAAFVIERDDGAVFLVRRPEKGLLAGMAGIPTTEWTASRDGETGKRAQPMDSEWQEVGQVHHTFTHFHLELEVWHTVIDQHPIEGWWSLPSNLKNEALPTLMKKAITAALPDAFTRQAT